jgi:hypothetical protein
LYNKYQCNSATLNDNRYNNSNNNNNNNNITFENVAQFKYFGKAVTYRKLDSGGN